MVNRCKVFPLGLQFTSNKNIRTITLSNDFSSKITEINKIHSKNLKNTQGYCQPTKESIYYDLPLHTHDEDHFHHPQV